MSSSNIEFSSNMEQKLEELVTERLQNGETIELPCPHCGAIVTAHLGENTCPSCGKSFVAGLEPAGD